MGTNYYVDTEPCAHCGAKSNTLHIGKSSIGWRFLFAPYPEFGLTSWRAWKAYLANRVITDEYGQRIDLADLKARVEAKQSETAQGDHTTVDADGYRFARHWDFT